MSSDNTEKKEFDYYHVAYRRHFIIGFTSHNSVVIWVAANKYYQKAKVQINTDRPLEIKLLACDDYTQTVYFGNLTPNTEYIVNVEFINTRPVDLQNTYRNLKKTYKRLKGTHSKDHCEKGYFQTFPDPRQEKLKYKKDFSFLVGSCNLSTITLNHVAAEAVGSAGLWLTSRSLKGRPDSVETKKTLFVSMVFSTGSMYMPRGRKKVYGFHN